MQNYELYIGGKLIEAYSGPIDLGSDDGYIKIGDGFLVHGKAFVDGVEYKVLSDGFGNYKLIPSQQPKTVGKPVTEQVKAG